MRMFVIFSGQERRYCKMQIYIVCLILLVHTSTNLGAPAPNRMQRIRFQRDSENGSGDSCCVRRPKLQVLESRGIHIHSCIFLMYFHVIVKIVLFYRPYAEAKSLSDCKASRFGCSFRVTISITTEAVDVLIPSLSSLSLLAAGVVHVRVY